MSEQSELEDATVLDDNSELSISNETLVHTSSNYKRNPLMPKRSISDRYITSKYSESYIDIESIASIGYTLTLKQLPTFWSTLVGILGLIVSFGLWYRFGISQFDIVWGVGGALVIVVSTILFIILSKEYAIEELTVVTDSGESYTFNRSVPIDDLQNKKLQATADKLQRM